MLPKGLQRHSLKTRITVATLLVFLASLWVLSLYAIRMMRADMEALLGEQQFAMVSNVAAEVSGKLEDRLNGLMLNARAINADALGDSARRQGFLEQRHFLRSLFNGGVSLVGRDGRLLASVSSPGMNGHVTGRVDVDAVNMALAQGRALIGRPREVRDAAGGLYRGFTLVAPVFDGDGRVVAALTGETSLDTPSFLDQVTAGRFGTTGGFLVLDRQQRVMITATDKTRIMERQPAPGLNPTIDRFFGGYEGSAVFTTPRGLRVLGSTKAIAVADWMMAVTIPTDEAFVPIRTMQNRLAAATLLLTLLAGGLTWWLLRRELLPLQIAAQALSDHAAANELSSPLPVKRADEIGLLVAGFNRLLETLGKRNAELQQSADLLNEAQSVAGIGSYTHDVSEQRWQSSAVLDRLFGIDAAYDRSVAGWLKLIHPDDAAMMADYFVNEVVGKAQPFDKVYRIVRRSDGAVRWVHGLGRLDLDAQGVPVTMHGTIQDVTERVRADAALRESHEMLASILATTKDGYWRIDAQGLLIDVNPAYCRLSGYSRDELIGRHVSEIDSESAAETQKRIDSVHVGGSEQFETVHRRRDGSLWNVEVSATFDAARGGEIIAFLRDISERKWAMEVAEKRIVSLTQPLEGGAIAIEDLFTRDELQRVQDDFSEATGVASIITYPDGTPFTRPSNFTRFCYEIIRATDQGNTNCERSDCVLGRYHPSGPIVQPCLSGGLWDAGVSISVGGHHVASWLIGQVRDEAQDEASMRAYARQIGADEEALVAAFNDVPAMSRGRFEVIARALFALANQLSTIAYQNVQQARFITDRRRVAEELEQHRNHLEELVASRTEELERARQIAEAASRSKSTFLANMSHEIRTPLNGIVGMTHILRRGVVTAVQAERLDKIDTAAKHLLATINDILDLSKIEAGKVVLDEVPLNVGSVLANVRSIIETRALVKGLRLEVAPSDFLPELCGDPTRLQQALLNYVGNAVKFTESGSVRMRARLLQDDADSVLLRFEVEDTGIGIPENVVARLFNAFEQAENSTTRKYGGSGLGLAITRRLAELMGGEAGVKSVAGVGSTFWFTAWLSRNTGKGATPAQLMTEAERKLRARHRGRRILLADDEPLNLEVAKFLLDDVGLVVVTAADGVEALAKAQQMDFAAILMDMQMPNLDGVNATRRIRALPERSDVPILAMTANAFAEDKAICLDAGMNDFLAKPFVPEALFSCLLRWLEPENDLLGLDHALLVGVPVIDDEHRSLVSHLDDLINDPGVPLGSTGFRTALDALGEHIGTHFASEERIVKSFDMPDDLLARHVAAHAEIVEQFHDLCGELDRGAVVDRATVIATVRRWIIDHVIAHDLSIRDHVPSRRLTDH